MTACHSDGSSIPAGLRRLTSAQRALRGTIFFGLHEAQPISKSKSKSKSKRLRAVARFLFLDPVARTFYRDWEGNARQIVAILRTEAGRYPYDRILSDLIGELSTRDDLFRKLWASPDVKEHRTGLKSLHHPVAGDLDLTFEQMDLSNDRGLALLAFSAAPGSPSSDGLRLLATWAATNLDTDDAEIASKEAAGRAAP